VKNKYDFQVGDIIIEEDKTWHTKEKMYVYHILNVQRETKESLEGYIPDDCRISVMYNCISGSLEYIDSLHTKDYAVHDPFYFSQKVWDTHSCRTTKIRGDQEFLLVSGSWKKI